MSDQIFFFKETSVPSQPKPNSVYAIKRPDSNYVELYVTTKTGEMQRLINESDVNNIINSKFAAAGSTTVVDDIAARNALQNVVSGAQVYVVDASADTNVTSGGAMYIYNGTTWIKTSETESMDVILQWSGITGRPNSTPTEIDNAVQASHTHANKSTLDKFSESVDGRLQFDGKSLSTDWNKLGW